MLTSLDIARLNAYLDRTPITGSEAQTLIGLKIKLADLARAAADAERAGGRLTAVRISPVPVPDDDDLGQDAAMAVK